MIMLPLSDDEARQLRDFLMGEAEMRGGERVFLARKINELMGVDDE